jgi:drug/metabolite transporter (DMT)-like permease
VTRRQAIALVVGAGAAFATSGPLARWAEPMPPLWICFGRVLLAALFLSAIGNRRELRAAARPGIALAGALLAAHFALFVWGLQQTSLPAAVTLVSLEPLSVVLLAWLLQGIRPTLLEQAGVAMATVGAVWMARGAGRGKHRLFGDLLVIGAVGLYGLYISAARAFRRELSAGGYAAVVYGWAAVWTGLALLVTREAPQWTGRSSTSVVLLALIPTVIGHTTVQAAARTASPSLVALVSPMETLGALVLGAVWLGAWPTGTELGGAAVIVAGVTVGILGAR